MAKKTIFQNINDEAVERLGIEEGVYYGVYSSSNLDNICTVLGTEDSTAFHMIDDLLTTETTNSLSKLKKGFILPGSSVSADRIKEACKEHSVFLTNDYESADFIINDGCSTINDMTTHDKFSVKSLLHTYTNGYILEATQDNKDHLGKSFSNYVEDMLNADVVLYDKRIGEYHTLHSLDSESAPYDNHIITGLAINLADLIQSKDLEVVDVNTILSASSNVQVLTPELLEQMHDMYSSGGADKEMLGSLLCTIDYTKTPALMWKLAQLIGNQEYNWSRNKDVKYWYNVSNINHLHSLCAEEAIEYFIQEGVMDRDNFKLLEPICREEIYISNRELYSFTVQVKPEYRKYLKKEKL